MSEDSMKHNLPISTTQWNKENFQDQNHKSPTYNWHISKDNSWLQLKA